MIEEEDPAKQKKLEIELQRKDQKRTQRKAAKMKHMKIRAQSLQMKDRNRNVQFSKSSKIRKLWILVMNYLLNLKTPFKKFHKNHLYQLVLFQSTQPI